MVSKSPSATKRLLKWRQLGFLVDDDDEGEEEGAPMTSNIIKLVPVDSGNFVEWAQFGAKDGLHPNPVWEVEEDKDAAYTRLTSVQNAVDEYDECEDDTVEDEEQSRINRWRKTTTQERDLRQLADSPYILLYIGRRGEAELIRLLFIAAGEKYVDKLVIEEDLDRAMEQDTPYKTLPVIMKGPYSWGGGEAIPRMLARKFYLMGQTNHEHLVVEAMFERLCRLKRTHAAVISQLNVEIKKREKADWVEHQLRYVILPHAMAEWEKMIMGSKGPYIVASGMTLADLSIVDFLDQCCSKIHIKDLLADFDALADLIMLVKRLPGIATYLDERHDNEGGRRAPSEKNLTGR